MIKHKQALVLGIDTVDELREMARGAVRCHFGDGVPGPMRKIIRLHFVRDEALAV